ncbi:hypothetical protein J6590_075118 [Homalodisca vitripennis]|nr:hypothetical protein J6590_075118 [Homalodisca vitripennis]
MCIHSQRYKHRETWNVTSMREKCSTRFKNKPVNTRRIPGDVVLASTALSASLSAGNVRVVPHITQITIFCLK